MRTLLPVALLLASGSAWAQQEAGDEEESGEESEDDSEDGPPSRDDEIFGAPSRDDEIFGGPAPTAAPAAPADPAVPGGPTLTDADIFDRLGTADERLTIGGRAYLRLDAAVPDKKKTGLDDVALSNPNLLDLYADGRPNDRVRAYVRGRLRHDLTVTDGEVDPLTGVEARQTSVTLDQLWLNFDLWRKVYVTAGRQRIKWGAGRFWNPTDFLAPGRLDALAFLDERTGVGLIKLHAPLGTANLYAIADIEEADTLDQVGGAARLEWVLGQTELAASAALRKDTPERYGFQLSSGVWLFDLRGEVAVQHGVATPFWKGALDFATFTMPTEYSREDDWIVQAVGGAEIGFNINDEDSLFIGGEYFYNDAGYDDAGLYPWLLLQGQAEYFYLGRQYFGVYAFLPGPGKKGIWDDMNWTVSALGNLSDQTTIARFDWSAVVLTQLTVNAYVAGHFGDAGGEFRFALDVPAIPGVLPDGLVVKPPLVDVGAGATVNF